MTNIPWYVWVLGVVLVAIFLWRLRRKKERFVPVIGGASLFANSKLSQIERRRGALLKGAQFFGDKEVGIKGSLPDVIVINTFGIPAGSDYKPTHQVGEITHQPTGKKIQLLE